MNRLIFLMKMHRVAVYGGPNQSKREDQGEEEGKAAFFYRKNVKKKPSCGVERRGLRDGVKGIS